MLDDVQHLYTLEAEILVDKGFILFQLKSGQEVKVKANSLGDGIKRLVKFFKALKKTLRAEVWEEYNDLAGHIETLLEKHEIDLEAL